MAKAHSAQAAAEHAASNARKQAASESEQRAQADEAAEHTLHEAQQMQVKLADALSAKTRAETEKDPHNKPLNATVPRSSHYDSN